MSIDTTPTTRPATDAPSDDPFAGLPPIFRDCAARDDSGTRYSFREPIRQGDYVYATDCRIVVRSLVADLPAAAVATTETVARPNFNAVYVAAKVDAAATPLDAIDDAPSHRPCHVCKGNGWLNCNMGHDHECEECDGGQVADLRHVVITTPAGVAHRICHCWAAVLKRHGVELHLPVVVGDVATFRGVAADGVKFEGVVTTVDPKTPTKG